MKVSLVLNLVQGSPEEPVDVRYIGPNCKLPIIRHRLQRLFNRKLIDTIVQFDTYRILDTNIGQKGHTTIRPSEIQRYWNQGIYDPVYRDIPHILRHRVPPTNNDRLKRLVSRFGRGMSGLALTTIPARPYSYSQDLVMNTYAYSMQFSNRLVGDITIPGAPNLAPVDGALNRHNKLAQRSEEINPYLYQDYLNNYLLENQYSFLKQSLTNLKN